ncbi:MAG: hypothetical protein QXJ19_03460 [Candidatus Bathyarchaeia archaeon]|nr:hypothetical protein [Candidatus Bathyarchaeota archaeon]
MERIHEERSLLERIVGYIPGYRGYKEKELRRESDRLVRMDVVNRLKAAKDLLRKRFASPVPLQRISSEDMWMLDSLMSRLDRIIQRIDRAVAGYAGMFDAIKVKEDKLEAALQLDLSLIERADSLKASAEEFVKAAPGGDEWRRCMDNLLSRIEEIDNLIDKRVEIFRGLTG